MSEIEIVGGLLDHYTPVPNDLFRTPGIKSRAVHVYGNLRSNRSGWKTNTRNVAESTGLNRRTVMDAINDLIELGYVERVAIAGKDGEFASYKYRVFDSPRGVENAPGDVVQKVHRDVVQKMHQAPGAESAPIKKNSFKKTNKEEHTPNPHGGRETAPDFDKWWETYPKKVGKGQARTAFKKALKKIDLDALTDKTRSFADFHEKAGTEKRFIPNPSTWLNGERWDDELDAPVLAGDQFRRTQPLDYKEVF